MSPGPAAPTNDIIISGAGYAGLALARALSMASAGQLKIALVDRTPPRVDPVRGSRAFAVSAASRHLLEQLGCWESIAPEAEAVLDIAITDSKLDDAIRRTELTYANLIPGGEAASHIVPDWALLAGLAQQTLGDPAIEIIAPASVAALDATSSLARVTLDTGRQLSAPLAVAADGRRSALREKAGIKVVGWTYPQTAIVTTLSHSLPHHGRAVQHFLPSGPFAILPLPRQRSCITWSEERSEAARIMALDDAGFLAEVEKRFAGLLGLLGLDGPRHAWPLEMHLARSFTAPRVALIGDAAHGVHPIAGQGVNLAFKDVAALAEVTIDAARSGLDIGATEPLERYERWRRFDSVTSAAGYDAINRLFSTSQPLVRAIRDFGLGVVDRLPGVKELLVREAAGLTGDLPKLLRGQAL